MVTIRLKESEPNLIDDYKVYFIGFKGDKADIIVYHDDKHYKQKMYSVGDRLKPLDWIIRGMNHDTFEFDGESIIIVEKVS